MRQMVTKTVNTHDADELLHENENVLVDVEDYDEDRATSEGVITVKPRSATLISTTALRRCPASALITIENDKKVDAQGPSSPACFNKDALTSQLSKGRH